MSGSLLNRGMRTVLLASLRRHTRRYVASGVAVVIGVTFIMVTSGVSSAMREGLTADVGAPYEGVDVVLGYVGNEDAATLMDHARQQGIPAATRGYATEQVTRDGVNLGDDVRISEAPLEESLQWLDLVAGRQPTAPGQGVADHNAAKQNGVGVGDTVVVGSGPDTVEVEVVGLVDTPAMTGASLYLPWADLSRFDESLWIEAIAWGGTAEQALAVVDDEAVDVWTTADYVADQQAQIVRGVDYLAIMALLFVAIALFVAVMVIANTFSILFAQRMRDFALLRCVGVTRRQLRRSVRLEALVLGLVSSTLGVLVGMAAGTGVVALVGIWFDAIGSPAFGLPWVLGSIAVGTAVTVAAAWLPTRAATRVAPLAALRPDTGVEVASRAGVLRLLLAGLALVGGVALLALAIDRGDLVVMLAGGTVTFLGVLLLGPVLVPALIRLAGRLLGDGPVRRLATGNAVRNPRRTATTAASLLVGVTLTTAVLTGLHSSRTIVDEEMDLSNPLDSALLAVDQPLADDVGTRAKALTGVEETLLLPGTTARLVGAPDEVTLVGVADAAAVARDASRISPADGVIHLPYKVTNSFDEQAMTQWTEEGTVTVRVDGRDRVLDVETGTGWGQAGLVSAATLASLTPDTVPSALWVRAADGADAEDLRGDLAVLASGTGADLLDGYSERTWVGQQIDILTGAVVGLLGIAVLIALVGIANTLGLSVLERGRENALLRAMGLTRGQLRRAMATEGLLLSMVATVLGTAIGLAFAWVAVQVMVGQVTQEVAFSVPALQLAAVVAVAALAGLAACVLPARRASRVAPAAGLAME
ncbi:FtsX-like permease family protein [Nocardioides campestrisoli]|uniref:FtsX-like permease family protein n=1 Tax=Nocardioides campestrisoli TaxID=2736757 RepID=UPI0015E69CE5|nr:ABC transporter permease [Nocardioides campestrisoli]